MLRRFQETMSKSEQMIKLLVGEDGESGYLGNLNHLIQSIQKEALSEREVRLLAACIIADTRTVPASQVLEYAMPLAGWIASGGEHSELGKPLGQGDMREKVSEDMASIAAEVVKSLRKAVDASCVRNAKDYGNPPGNRISVVDSFIGREYARVKRSLIQAVPGGSGYDQLYAAQQALGWALDPGNFKSPHDMIMGIQSGSVSCSDEDRPPQS